MRTRIVSAVSLLALCGVGGTVFAQTLPSSAPRVVLDAPIPLVETPQVAQTPVIEFGEPMAPGAAVVPTPRKRVVRAQNDFLPDPDPIPVSNEGGGFGVSSPAPTVDEILSRPAMLESPEGARRVSGIRPVQTRDDEEERYNSGFTETRVRPNAWLEKHSSRRKNFWEDDARRDENVAIDQELLPKPKRSWWSRFGEGIWGDSDNPGSEPGDRDLCQSDTCCRNGWISPLTNTFLAEDPRALTELKTVFLYQIIPDEQSLYRGGNIEMLALQGRIAFTERWSLVFHKIGGMWIQPGDNSIFSNQSGFTEIWLGPKYTFIRGKESQTFAAGGIQFQLPTGANEIYQDTGNLSIVPYLSVSQKFLPTRLGTWMVHDTLGYSFSTNDQRSDYIYNTLHLSLDVGDQDKIFPLIELNWFRYTTNGSARPFFGFEGRDLGNVGAQVSGRDLLTVAAGARYKFSERFQCGAAAEFPLTEQKDLFDFRLTLDFIWRY